MVQLGVLVVLCSKGSLLALLRRTLVVYGADLKATKLFLAAEMRLVRFVGSSGIDVVLVSAPIHRPLSLFSSRSRSLVNSWSPSSTSHMSHIEIRRRF